MQIAYVLYQHFSAEKWCSETRQGGYCLSWCFHFQDSQYHWICHYAVGWAWHSWYSVDTQVYVVILAVLRWDGKGIFPIQSFLHVAYIISPHLRWTDLPTETVYVFTCMGVGVLACAHTVAEARQRWQSLCFASLHFIPLRQSLSQSLEVGWPPAGLSVP